MSNVVELFSPEAPIVKNDRGGLQSKTAGAFHMLPGSAMRRLKRTYMGKTLSMDGHIEAIYDSLALLLADDDTSDYLGLAFKHAAFAIELDEELCHEQGVQLGDEYGLPATALLRMANVLDEGAKRYARGNWRLIDYSSHVNHALQHLVAFEMGDETDDHLGHLVTRLAMAIECEDKSYRFTAIEAPRPPLGQLYQFDRKPLPTDASSGAIFINGMEASRFLAALPDDQWQLFTGTYLANEFNRRDVAIALSAGGSEDGTGFERFSAGAAISYVETPERDGD